VVGSLCLLYEIGELLEFIPTRQRARRGRTKGRLRAGTEREKNVGGRSIGRD